jgi:L-histidine N-alpha-methyltransferase
MVEVTDEVTDEVTVEVHLDQADWATHLAEETLAGLRDDPPWIPPVWFYDETGSALFDRITRLPEYYPTETERGILARHASDVAARTGATTLAEIGSGTSDKTALLLDALEAGGTLERFVPFDCSEEVLRAAATSIAAERPGLRLHAVVGDFHRHLDELPTDGTCLLAFLGSTIGNLDPQQRKGFLAEVRACLDADDRFLLGTDLVKPPRRLIEAYDDSAGVTARFNLNCLAVMNRELGADFDLDAFHHRAVWNAPESRVEMHLVARRRQQVHVPGLGGEDVRFDAGDHLRTEISTKFTPAQVEAELAEAGLRAEATFQDPAGDFQLSLCRPD